jgi:hypothetical protein
MGTSIQEDGFEIHTSRFPPPYLWGQPLRVCPCSCEESWGVVKGGGSRAG